MGKKAPAPTNANDVQLGKARFRLLGRVVDGGYKALRTAIVCGSGVAGVYFVMKGLEPFAGKETELNSIIKWAFTLNISQWAGWAVAAVSGGGWAVERKLRQRTIAQTETYVRELEQRVDHSRSSSRLLPSGKTRTEDRDE